MRRVGQQWLGALGGRCGGMPNVCLNAQLKWYGQTRPLRQGGERYLARLCYLAFRSEADVVRGRSSTCRKSGARFAAKAIVVEAVNDGSAITAEVPSHPR